MIHQLSEDGLTEIHPSLSVIAPSREDGAGGRFPPENIQTSCAGESSRSAHLGSADDGSSLRFSSVQGSCRSVVPDFTPVIARREIVAGQQ